MSTRGLPCCCGEARTAGLHSCAEPSKGNSAELYSGAERSKGNIAGLHSGAELSKGKWRGTVLRCGGK
ncbi:MAG: hypothetical protein IJI41_04470 [Anaerolineaceae bacterium]|nr:hypothetical protein [Anaerolineaceae bacterium]